MAIIKRKINKIPENVLKIVFENFEKRCHMTYTIVYQMKSFTLKSKLTKN